MQSSGIASRGIDVQEDFDSKRLNLNGRATTGSQRERQEIRDSFLSEDDVEFDDTIDEDFVIEKNSKTRDRENLSNGNGYYEKNTTITIPLKDDMNRLHKAREKENTLPITLKSPSRHRTWRGTPLRKPSMKELRRYASKGTDEDNEDIWIKKGQLITEDNQFSPNILNVNNSQSQVHSSPLSKRTLVAETSSPPHNFRVRKPSFDAFDKLQKKKPKANKSASYPYDIEFDPSDNEEDAKARRVSAYLEHSSTPQSKEGGKDKRRIHRENLPEHYFNSSVHRIEERNSSSNFSISKSPNTLHRQNSALREADDDKNNIIPSYQDISREEILDKINRTIDSLREKEASLSPQKPSIIHDLEDSDSDSDLTSNEAPADILNELDSFMNFSKTNGDTQGLKSGVETSSCRVERTTNVDMNKAEDMTDFRNGKVRKPTRLESKYAGHIAKSRKKSDRILDKTKKSLGPRGTKWTKKKWNILNKVVQSKKLSTDDIVNSSILKQLLNCSKADLKERVEFLNSLNHSE